MAYTTIKKPSDYFNTVLYSGDGTSNRNITGVNFQPDLVWIKNRNNTNSQQWVDSVRGLFRLGSDSTAAEASVSGAFNSFDADGFNVTEEVNWEFNNSGKTYASWNWLAGGTASSNTDGSITSNVSANTTSGFSIVSYTGNGTAGATVGHGLSSAPEIIFQKCRSDSSTWWHVGSTKISTGFNSYLHLNNTDAVESNSIVWNNTNPTSSVFSLGNGDGLNASSRTYIAYCFHSVKGYSKIGTYTGNGNADGTFVYTGFKPAFVILKRINISASWSMWDNERGYNGDIKVLYPDLSNSENNGDYMDFVSNGIKLRDGNSKWNASGDTYIYMAFAEEPLVGDNPCTAR